MARPYVCPNNRTSVRNILYSLMSSPHAYDKKVKSNNNVHQSTIDKGSNEQGPNKLIESPTQSTLFDHKKYDDKLEKIVQMVQTNENEIRKAVLLIESLEDTCKKQGTILNSVQTQKKQFHDLLMKWLLKQVTIGVNDFHIQGVLTEISSEHEYLTLVLAEYIYIIPFEKIHFIKLNV
ncbi:MAG: hypothetical protein GX375_00720 [Clostridiales bacterium]|nr:hypothetical protein [Clostridiales bacterium]